MEHHIHDGPRDMIIRGGENIYPAEVDAVLSRHPAVGGCAVIAIPDAHWGQVVGAFIVPAPGHHDIDIGALRAFCRADLAGFKVPTRWEILESLPRNPTGKVLRRPLVLRD